MTDESTWRFWAASRAQLAALVKEMSTVTSRLAVLDKTAISLPQFDRPFVSADEFLENVDSGDRVNTGRFGVELRTSSGLTIDLSGNWDGRVELRLYGGQALDRNALKSNYNEPSGASLVRGAPRPRRFARDRSLLGSP